MNEKERETRFFELIVTLLFLAFSVVMLIVAYTTQKPTNRVVNVMKAMTFPKIILTIMLLGSLFVLANTLYWFYKNRGHALPDFKKLITKKTAVTYVMILAYIFGWEYLGFFISTFLFFAVESKLMNMKQPVSRIVLIALVFTIATNLVFKTGFQMFFPEPIYDAFLNAFIY